MPIQPLDALRAIAEQRGDAVAVSTMTTVEPWHRFSPSDLNVTCIGFMGGASSLGLGLALARPERRVIVLDGDGSLLMQLGSLATVAGAAPPNFYHFVFKNGVYQVSGSQPIPSAGAVDFAVMARGAGYAHTYSFDNLEDFRVRLAEILAARGPVLVQLLTDEMPNPPRGGVIGAGASFPNEAETARAALAGERPPA
jgi:sulfopyruvate decarboxylase subunit beta